MRNALEGKNIVLGVTGSIASYKALDAASKLTQAGAFVDVILTSNAEKFITRLSFQSITHREVYTDLFDSASDLAIHHVALAERADLIAVYPATANTIAKVAHGMADDTLSTTILASRAPLLVAPAMDGYMYNNPVTQSNLELLKKRAVDILGPAIGHLASGLTGAGRLVEPTTLLEQIKVILGRQGDLTHLSIVVSAGGTQEPIDPVRVITNHSSGKMGYAIAEAARDRGAKVTLVTAAIIGYLFESEVGTTGLSALVMATCASLLTIGHYKWLDRSMKLIMAVLFLATCTAFSIALSHGPIAANHYATPSAWNIANLGFISNN